MAGGCKDSHVWSPSRGRSRRVEGARPRAEAQEQQARGRLHLPLMGPTSQAHCSCLSFTLRNALERFNTSRRDHDTYRLLAMPGTREP